MNGLLHIDEQLRHSLTHTHTFFVALDWPRCFFLFSFRNRYNPFYFFQDFPLAYEFLYFAFRFRIMGKKKKPENVKAAKLYNKVKNRNFALVFIKPTLDDGEKLSRTAAAKRNQLIAQTQIVLTTKNFKKIETIEADELDDDDDDGLMYDSDIYDEEDDGEQEAENDFDKDKVEDSVDIDNQSARSKQIEIDHAEKITLNQMLLFLETNCDLKLCEKEKISFKNDHLIKFNVNFELKSPLSFQNISQIFAELSKLLANEKSKKFKIEIPFDVICRVMKNLRDNHMVSDFERFDIRDYSMGTTLNLSKYVVHYQIPDMGEIAHNIPMLLELKYRTRSLCIYFSLDPNKRVHKMFYSFSSFRSIVLEQHDSYYRVYFECTQTPSVSYADLDPQLCEVLKELDVCDVQFLWQRTVKLRIIPKRYSNIGCNLNDHQRKPIDINLVGMCNSFCIDIRKRKGDSFIENLIHIVFLCRERNKVFQFYISNLQHKIFEDFTYIQLKTKLSEYRFPFSIHFSCLVFFSASYKALDALQDEKCLHEFIAAIQRELRTATDDEALNYLERSLYYLKVQCREQVVLNVFSEFMKILKRRKELPKEALHDDYVLIRKATLYPSHLELEQPVALLKSRFSNLADIDYALRIKFWDDGGRLLNKCKSKNEYEFIMSVLKQQLLHGLKIGDRVYEFLGSSTSQMRDFGCTLYASDSNGRNAEDIRNAAGELRIFNHNVSKYIARFGLVFSQSMTLIEIGDDVTINYIPDIEGAVKPDCRNYVNHKRERYIMSDGVGQVERSVAESFLPYLDVKCNYFPSAYQIRYGGCKGMLTVWDLPKPCMRFRKSMRKYESNSRVLGILKYSWPRWVYLNRPLICILDFLNVDRDEIYDYFYQSTASVAKATLYDSCAMDLIRIYATGLLPYDHIYNSSISLLDEPFLRSIINYLIYYRLNFELKWKARIRVPNNVGRIAFGVIDETGLLEPGEVYFRYTKMTEDGTLLPETVPLEGEVMVTKFPCLQPGDVRKFTARDVPALRHIKDCLVFPQKGDRPHPDEMSGSDLDGDEYAIFWDTLRFEGENREPMHFPYGLSKSLQNEITVEDLIDFFCKYLLMTNIGMVANNHLLIADFHHQGLGSYECADLAFTYNISLDFPKTGVIEFIPRKYFPEIRPDFMERNAHDKIYLSKKLLGEYYRHCALVEQTIELSQYDYRFSMFDPAKKQKKSKTNYGTSDPFKREKSLIKNRLILADWKKFHKEAEEAFFEYKLKVIDIMEQLEVENEVMLFADVYEDKKDSCQTVLKHFFDYFQAKFRAQCAANRCTYTMDRYYLASAWYAICYEKNFHYNGKPLLGMPWIISREMCQLSQFSFSGKVATQATLAANVRTMIIDGERITFTLGVNHKEVVPYCAERALVHGVLLDYQLRNVFNTDVINFYWSPVWVNRAFELHCPHLLPLHLDMIDEMQLNLTLTLIMYWIETIRKRIYRDTFHDRRTIVLFDRIEHDNSGEHEEHDPTTEGTKVEENELLQQIIMKHLREIQRNCGRKRTEFGESSITISTLFNQFMLYLFEICNRVNRAIYHSTIEEIYLLKYAIFALSFINKLDAKLDRKFYVSSAIEFAANNWTAVVHMLEQSYRKRRDAIDGEDKSSPLRAPRFAPKTLTSTTVYQRCIDSLFDTYLVENNFLAHEKLRFNLLPTDRRIPLEKVDEMLLRKMNFLCGVMAIEITLSTEDPMPYASKSDNQEYFQGPIQRPPQQHHPQPSSSSGDSIHLFAQSSESLVRNAHQLNRSEKISESNSVSGNHQKPKAATMETSEREDSKNEKPQEAAAEAADAPTSPHYSVKVSGLTHCVQIFRLLIGHPLFFANIFYRFNVIEADVEESESGDKVVHEEKEK